MQDELNFASIIPLYKQISHNIAEEIIMGNLKPGDKLPPEKDLMERFKVSRITIRAATDDLAEDGLIVKGRGKGSFVASQDKSSAIAKDVHGLTVTCASAGKSLETKVLSMDYIFPTTKDCRDLRIKQSESILESRRLRIVDGKKAIIEVNHYIPSLSFLGEEDLTGSLYEILRKHNVEAIQGDRTLEICRTTKTEASLFDIAPGTPLIMFRDIIMKSDDEKPIFTSKQLYNTQDMIIYL